MSKDLHLVLTRQWYDRHLQDKREDYREITPYWAKHLCENFDFIHPFDGTICEHNCASCLLFTPKQFDNVVLMRGYTRTQTIKEHISTTIGVGNLDWGASGKNQFIIKVK